MIVNGRHYRTIWLNETTGKSVFIINQLLLPHFFETEEINSWEQMTEAIKDMRVRGAGLIGAAAGYAMYLAALQAKNQPDFNAYIHHAAKMIAASRPTAVNLSWAVNRQLTALQNTESPEAKIAAAKSTAIAIANEDAECCRQIGKHGVELLKEIAQNKNGAPVNVLTHCNAGWLAFVDYGSALAPVYEAHSQGINIHVWVSETRPRNQGASLTAWELQQQGVPYTVIADNTSGHLLQNKMADIVITGADRVTRTGDVANKIGTYLKALAAHDNKVPFYVALPSSTFDWNITNGLTEIEIEQRHADEVKYLQGFHQSEIKKVLLTPFQSAAANYGFDVTPSRLISGLITERGICPATEPGIMNLFSVKK